MTIRAKFKVQRTESTLQSINTGKDEKGTQKWGIVEVQTIILSPVTSGSEENQRFYASTPSGEIKIGVLKAGMFNLGKEYYVDFTEAEPK